MGSITWQYEYNWNIVVISKFLEENNAETNIEILAKIKLIWQAQIA